MTNLISSTQIARAARNFAFASSLAIALVGCNSVMSPVADNGNGTPGNRNEDGGGSSPQNGPVSVYLAKLAPLTTIEHQVSGEITVPLGYPVSLRADASNATDYLWKGLPKQAGMTDEGYHASSASMTFSRAGVYNVLIIPVQAGRESAANQARLTIRVLPVAFNQLHIRLSADGASGGSGDGDGTKNGAPRQQSIIPNGSAQVAVNADLSLKARSFPAGFESMVEWRIDGQAQKSLAKATKVNFSTMGDHTVQGGDAELLVEVTSDDGIVTQH